MVPGVTAASSTVSGRGIFKKSTPKGVPGVPESGSSSPTKKTSLNDMGASVHDALVSLGEYTNVWRHQAEQNALYKQQEYWLKRRDDPHASDQARERAEEMLEAIDKKLAAFLA